MRITWAGATTHFHRCLGLNLALKVVRALWEHSQAVAGPNEDVVACSWTALATASIQAFSGVRSILNLPCPCIKQKELIGVPVHIAARTEKNLSTQAIGRAQPRAWQESGPARQLILRPSSLPVALPDLDVWVLPERTRDIKAQYPFGMAKHDRTGHRTRKLSRSAFPERERPPAKRPCPQP